VSTSENLDESPFLSNLSSSQTIDIYVQVEGVISLLKDLQSHKACGPDRIPPRLLKETANNIAPALSLIYNTLLTQGKLPDDWKRSYIVQFFKGSHASPANCRCQLSTYFINVHLL